MAEASVESPPKTRSPFLDAADPLKIVVLPAVSDQFLEEHGVKSWETWGSEVCVKTYPYKLDEDFWFVRGLAVVTPIAEDGARGEPVTIKAGDYCCVPLGVVAEWDVREPVHKHWREYH